MAYRKINRRFVLNVQEPHQVGWTLMGDNDAETVGNYARKMVRDFLRPGLRVTVYDTVTGRNLYDETVPAELKK